MKHFRYFIYQLLLVSFLWNICFSGYARTKATDENFKIICKIGATPVKNQGKSFTCWSYTVISMIESELLTSGKGEYNLSEMFVVHQAYIEKAERFVRMHGTVGIGGGGGMNDPVDIIAKYGIVPTEVYTGLKNGCSLHIHSEMDASLKDYLVKVVNNKKLPSLWKEGFINLLDSFLGKVPEKFIYKNVEYTPVSFAKMIGFNPQDYTLFSSFSHHPYYGQFIIEIPDNWSCGRVYNLPLDELERTVDYSLEKGISVAIAIDITEKGFMWRDGIAIALNDSNDRNQNDKEILLITNDSTKLIFHETHVTPQLRQEAFDSYETTDDHGLHIVGKATDRNGNKFYIAKNSWGADASPFQGYLYVSEQYFLFKTITVLVNKNGIPSDILQK
jgi:bleomycin hydrolase